MSQDFQNKISGEKIYVEGHRIEMSETQRVSEHAQKSTISDKPKVIKMKDGHTGQSVIIKHGFAIIIKEFRWKGK